MHDDGIVLVPLTQGKFAVIDATDAERVLAFRWHAQHCHGIWYAARNAPRGTRPQKVLMHRVVLGQECPEVDHINGNGLDNRRSNLRPATRADNSHNCRIQVNNTSGFRGVSWCKRDQKWIAMIRSNVRQLNLGRFATAEEAARAYDAAAVRLHGDFARLNFPHDH
jgi:hypothetical protein